MKITQKTLFQIAIAGTILMTATVSCKKESECKLESNPTVIKDSRAQLINQVHGESVPIDPTIAIQAIADEINNAQAVIQVQVLNQVQRKLVPVVEPAIAPQAITDEINNIQRSAHANIN